MKTSEAVARRIKNLLAEKGMTQYRLCKNIAIHETTMSTILSAKNKSVNLDTIWLVCRGFGITIVDFFNDPIFDDSKIDID